jgi:hypothetical protein
MAEGGAACGDQGGSAPTVLRGAGRGKSCKGSAPRGGFDGLQATDGRGSEGGGSGWGVEPAEMGGGDGGRSSRRHAAAVPGALPQRRARERGVGLEAWRVVHGRLEGRAPLTGNWDLRAWLLVTIGATPVPLGWVVGVVCGVTSCGRHAP